MTQNAMHISWEASEVDSKLHTIMSNIHGQCVEHGKENGYVNYVKGAKHSRVYESGPCHDGARYHIKVHIYIMGRGRSRIIGYASPSYF